MCLAQQEDFLLFKGLNNISLNIYNMFSLPFHLLTNTSYFFILDIVANAAMNMGAQISTHLEVRLVNHIIVLFSLF